MNIIQEIKSQYLRHKDKLKRLAVIRKKTLKLRNNK